jgi:formylglycine-generating enzyme required for sulfatase activity
MNNLLTLAALLCIGGAAMAQTSGMVLIKGGTFIMGSPASEPERQDDEGQHRVQVGDFFLAATEVTQSQYKSLMGKNPSNNQGNNLPVENVTWIDAVNYCNALSRKEGLTPAYTVANLQIEPPQIKVTWNASANGYRLPTEAEWEYACRAGTTGPFNTGGNITEKEANMYNNYGYNNRGYSITGGYAGRTLPVKSFRPNAFGLYDMHGNVAEWCWDWYGPYPAGSAIGTYRVNRGGGWNDMPKHVRSAYRAAYPPDDYIYSIGFRVARNKD